jgi:cold shock CspA family protein
MKRANEQDASEHTLSAGIEDVELKSLKEGSVIRFNMNTKDKRARAVGVVTKI